MNSEPLPSPLMALTSLSNWQINQGENFIYGSIDGMTFSAYRSSQQQETGKVSFGIVAVASQMVRHHEQARETS